MSFDVIKEDLNMYKVSRIITIVLIIILILISCGKGSRRKLYRSELARIEIASDEQIEKISSAIKYGGTISDFKTIKSKDFDNVYLVSAIITDTSGDKHTGIWSTGGKTNKSIIMSANGAAKNYSPWTYGPDTKAGVSYKDEGGEILFNSY